MFVAGAERGRLRRPALAEARRRRHGAGLALGVVLLAVGFARSAEGRPQITSGVTMGAAFTDLRAENGPRLAYHLGGRLDLLFGRAGPREMAVGPYLEVLTAAFDTLETGGGVAWLVPTGPTAFVFSGGAFARKSRFGLDPGAAATMFCGPRSYNYHSTYGVSAGLFAQGRYGLGGDGRQADVVLGVQLDLVYIVLPWVFAYEAMAR